MLGAFATFLKKGSTKNFTEDKVLIYIVRSTVEHTMFALHPSLKVLVKLFQKLAGLGRAHKTALSFCQAFSLRLSCQRKSGIVRFYVF